MSAEASPSRLSHLIAFKDEAQETHRPGSSIVNGAMLLIADEIPTLPEMSPFAARQRQGELLMRQEDHLAYIRGRMGELTVSGKRKGIGRLRESRDQTIRLIEHIKSEFLAESHVEGDVFEKGIAYYERAVRNIEASKGAMVGRKKRRYEHFSEKLRELKGIQSVFGEKREDDRT